MSEIIVVTSGKGGVGKTTTTANIGIGLSRLDKKVIVIDTDLGLRNLDVVMGLENRIVYNLIDVIEGSCRMKQALIRDKQCDTLYLLPSAQTKDKTAITPEQMVKLTEDLSEEFDYILLDCPAGIEQGFKNAISGTFFNGITPFSSGGQFAQVYIFNRQGISPTNSASILLMANGHGQAWRNDVRRGCYGDTCCRLVRSDSGR